MQTKETVKLYFQWSDFCMHGGIRPRSKVELETTATGYSGSSQSKRSVPITCETRGKMIKDMGLVHFQSSMAALVS